MLLCCVLGSCARPMAVLLCPEAVPLKSLVESAVAGAPGAGKIAVASGSLAGGLATGTAKADVVRITTTPGWNLPPGLGPALPLPADWNPAYSPPPALASLGMTKDGKWSSIPILYDVWGQTTFAAKGAAPPPPGEWKELLGRAAPESLSVAGSRPSFRQAAFLFELFPELPPPGDAASWFGQSPTGWKSSDAVLPALVRGKPWARDTWSFTRGDQAVSYKQGQRRVFIETYRDYESTDPPGVRRFIPLSGAKEGSGYAMAGEVLFLEYRGSPSGLDRALKLMRVLAGDGFQKDAGMAAKWLAASRRAPEIDGTGAMIRRRVAGASRFFPVSDGLPESPAKDSLWTGVQLAVDRAPKQ